MVKKRKGSGIPGLSFSAKRAFGVTRAKQNFARKTGIPTTKSGMQRKIGRTVTGGGCLVSFTFMVLSTIAISLILISL